MANVLTFAKAISPIEQSVVKDTETMGLGQRWFDIKRYGIEIYRRVVNSTSQLDHITDTLGPDDLRRALQIPQKSRDAGFEANKR